MGYVVDVLGKKKKKKESSKYIAVQKKLPGTGVWVWFRRSMGVESS